MTADFDGEELLNDIFTKVAELGVKRHDTNDRQKVEEFFARQDYLRRMAVRRIGLGRSSKNMSFFISYSKAQGRRFAEQFRAEVESKQAEVAGMTGFDREFDTSKINEIWTSIAHCDAFLGVWTGDHKLESTQKRDRRSKESGAVRSLLYPRSEDNKYLPSPWMPVELGMALSLNKPWLLVVDKRVDRDFVLKISGDIHHMFEDWVDETLVEDGSVGSRVMIGRAQQDRQKAADDYYRKIAERARKAGIYRKYAGVFFEGEDGSELKEHLWD